MHGKAEVIIGKQRHGPTGTVELQFEAEVTRFANLARDDQLPEQLSGIARDVRPNVAGSGCGLPGAIARLHRRLDHGAPLRDRS